MSVGVIPVDDGRGRKWRERWKEVVDHLRQITTIDHVSSEVVTTNKPSPCSSNFALHHRHLSLPAPVCNKQWRPIGSTRLRYLSVEDRQRSASMLGSWLSTTHVSPCRLVNSPDPRQHNCKTRGSEPLEPRSTSRNIPRGLVDATKPLGRL